MNNKKIMSVLLVFILMLSTFTTVFAMDRDLTHKETSEKKLFVEYVFDTAFLGKLVFDGEMDNYYVEVGGKNYKLADVQAKFDGNPTITLEEAIEELEPVDSEESPTEEFRVIDISAIIDGTPIALGC